MSILEARMGSFLSSCLKASIVLLTVIRLNSSSGHLEGEIRHSDLSGDEWPVSVVFTTPGRRHPPEYRVRRIGQDLPFAGYRSSQNRFVNQRSWSSFR